MPTRRNEAKEDGKFSALQVRNYVTFKSPSYIVEIWKYVRSKSTALEGSRVRSSRKIPDLLLLSMTSEMSTLCSGVMELPLLIPQNRDTGLKPIAAARGGW